MVRRSSRASRVQMRRVGVSAQHLFVTLLVCGPACGPAGVLLMLEQTRKSFINVPKNLQNITLGVLRSSSCAKHYFAYNLENCYTDGDNCRLNFNAVLSQQDIEDTFLVFFFWVACFGLPPLCFGFCYSNSIQCCCCCWCWCLGAFSGCCGARARQWSHVLLQQCQWSTKVFLFAILGSSGIVTSPL